ncbi:MAG: TonB-dependent receptor plug domain-containing protein [Thermoanaerobaculia bacterium]
MIAVLSAGIAGAQEPVAEEVATEAQEAMETVEEVIVVTASRTEQRLQDAPAAMTVIPGEAIEEAPVDDYGDVLRNVPGVNVAQMSARDVQVTSRGSTNSLATSQLVLVDGRSIYLDFFGFVIWEYLPANPNEIEQVEVVRGPGSAVWGANAMTGVVNLITKRPQDMVGTHIVLGGGELSTLYGNATYAAAGETSGWKVSGGWYEQERYPRPTGVIPGTGTPYPAFENEGTEQPKFDLRFDWDSSEESSWRLSGGYASTDGIIHTGIGPFDIDQGSSLSYVQGGWAHGARHIGVFVNGLDGEASNLLTVGTDGRPLLLGFESQTYNLDYNETKGLAGKHILTWGANARKNDFDLTIAPAGDNRDEFGVFLQDEILFGDHFRWVLGARFDDIDPIGSVFSPRTSLMFAPNRDHTFRLSFNRAFRAPSLINNYLEIVIVNLVALPTGPYVFPSAVFGNPQLQEERLDAIEGGWVGDFGSTTASLSVYRNETTDSIDFYTAATYTCTNPPPGFPLPPILLCSPPPLGLEGLFPSAFSYRNLGEIVDQGVEIGFSGRAADDWRWFFNYSWQDEPDVTGIDISQVNLPPENRFNAGLAYSGELFFANGNLNYQDEAFWTDVLDSRFHGPTEEFTQLNLAFGVHVGDHATLQVNGQNVTDEDVQQHVFGDILSRKVTGQLTLDF